MWRALIHHDEGDNIVLPLRAATYDIGRAKGNTVRLTDINVSRWHARLFREGERYGIEDLESSQGTYVNRRRVQGESILDADDLVQIGDYEIRITGDAADDRDSHVESGPGVVVLEGADAGTWYPLSQELTVIGRGEDADILVDHPSISRRHCAIGAMPGGGYGIVDMRSANGVAVNGARVVEGRALENGDLVRLGEVALRFQHRKDAAVSQATADSTNHRRRAALVLTVAGLVGGGTVAASWIGWGARFWR